LASTSRFAWGRKSAFESASSKEIASEPPISLQLFEFGMFLLLLRIIGDAIANNKQTFFVFFFDLVIEICQHSRS